MIFYEEEYEEVDPYDDMLADDEDFIQTYLSKKFGVTKRENFMEFMKNASEYLENDWYRIYCVEKLKDPDFVDVQFVISDYEIYETAKLVCMTEPNSDEYKLVLQFRIFHNQILQIEHLQNQDLLICNI